MRYIGISCNATSFETDNHVGFGKEKQVQGKAKTELMQKINNTRQSN